MLSAPVATLLSLSTAWQFAKASPHHSQPSHNYTEKPPAFFLAGDSTTAVQNPSGGGYGVGFLSFLKSPAWGIDFGHDGATTVTFVSNGNWSEVIDSVVQYKDDYHPFVPIMFGDNDQKPAANISLDEYQANLESLAEQVKEAGGTPILFTPLSRRDFTSEYNMTLNLIDQRQYTIYAAQNSSTWWIDLNQASTEYVLAIGNTSAQVYDLDGTDETHLNSWGSVVFGRLVADLILGHVPEIGVDVDWEPPKNGPLTQWFIPNQTLSEELWGGLPA